MKKVIYLSLCLIVTLLLSACCQQKATGVYNVLDYGAKGDGITDDAVAIQKAIDECSAAGGGQVVFPAGKTFLSGPVELKSNVDYHLEINSIWRANPDESIYHLSAFKENEGEGMMWIWTKDTKNIAITGQGTIDGNGIAFMGEELLDSYELKPVTDFDPRPHVLTLMGVEKLQIRDITICNGAYWTVHLIGCYDASIIGISLLNNLKIRNGDGIDIDHSRKVRIADCYITSGDDCICLKNRREFEEYGPCQDITVTNCVMSGRSCAIKIGSENMDSISDVLIDNCIIKASNRGIGIQNRDEGTVTNVVFSNIIIEGYYFSDVWWGKAEPIYVTSYPRASSNHKDGNWRFPKGITEGRCGEVSNIWFRDIICNSENGAFIGGDTPEKVHDIYLENVNMTLAKRTDYPGGVYDKRPCKGEGFINDKTYGVYVENASNISIKDCKIIQGTPAINDFGGEIKKINVK
ncbi:MAG: glycoside hydrolase family 28 protein [Bacteroidales bacterium]|nr:glycoside hydrolase family 28 protein [Bacteroidales bacterium]